MVRKPKATVESRVWSPMASVFASSRCVTQGPHTGGEGWTVSAFSALTEEVRETPGPLPTAPQSQGINHIGKRHCLSDFLDIQQWGGQRQSGGPAAKMGGEPG